MAVASRARTGRAFTLLEVLVVILVTIVVAALLIGIVLTNMNFRRPRMASQIKCSANIRGIAQGLVLFSQSNKDQYPLPSLLDAANNTINADPSTKDTTANIISVLIYGTFFGPEICVSPAESNGNIVMDPDYYYTEPKTAANPKLALWDPAFSADFTSVGGSNFSYAHLLPSGPRLAKGRKSGPGAPGGSGVGPRRIGGIVSTGGSDHRSLPVVRSSPKTRPSPLEATTTSSATMGPPADPTPSSGSTALGNVKRHSSCPVAASRHTTPPVDGRPKTVKATTTTCPSVAGGNAVASVLGAT